jgi:DNA primase
MFVSIYCTTPTVSTPVTWDEVKTSLRKKEPLEFDYRQVLRRVETFGDLFVPTLKIKQRLPELDTLKILSAQTSHPEK